MTSWVYIFSKFTTEALLFESLLIFLLCCGYAAFWVLRKRRYGSIDTDLPSGPVKSYLNELISNTEQLRLQLFGLLASSDFTPAQTARFVENQGNQTAQLPQLNLRAVSPSANSQDLSALENKVSDQSRTIERLTGEKAALEKTLADMAATQSGLEGAGTAGLQDTIQELQSRLQEYSVIEDDLANLKRLQRENALLKQSLAQNGIPTPNADLLADGANLTPPVQDKAPEAAAIAPAAAPPPAAPPTVAKAAAPPSPPDIIDAALAATPTDAPLPPLPEQSGDSLAAEFEKMING